MPYDFGEFLDGNHFASTDFDLAHNVGNFLDEVIILGTKSYKELGLTRLEEDRPDTQDLRFILPFFCYFWF